MLQLLSSGTFNQKVEGHKNKGPGCSGKSAMQQLRVGVRECSVDASLISRRPEQSNSCEETIQTA